MEAVMRLEAGKKYTDRRGRVYGPLIEDEGSFYEDEYGTNWWPDGRVSTKKESLADLVAEYVEPVPAASIESLANVVADVIIDAMGEPDPATFPQYWTKAQCAPREVAFVRRISATAFVVIMNDGTESEQRCWSPKDSVYRKQITEVEAMAMIKKPESVVPEKSVLQKAYEAAAKCMDCTTCGDFCEKTSNPTEVWPKWFQIAEGHIAEFPETGGSTNYRRGEKDTEGYPASHYHGQFPEFWKQITSFDAMSLMSKWGHIENATPKTRTVTLREWACWEDERESDVTLVWSSRDPTIDDDGFIGWDNAVLTGDVRSIELPVSQ